MLKSKKSVAKNGKENSCLPRELMSNPVSEKIEKFGSSIRSRIIPKASQEVLKDLTVNSNRRSAILNTEKPVLQDINININKMSFSIIVPNSNDEKNNDSLKNSRCSNMSKSKSVRFSQFEESDSSKFTLNRSQSILRNSNSCDKLSQASYTSHAGFINGGLSNLAKNSMIKDNKGVNVHCNSGNSSYEKIMKKFDGDLSKRYFDDLFPPGSASLFYEKRMVEENKEIRWARMQDIFPGQKLVLYSHEDRNMVHGGSFQPLNYMATCFNALGTSPRCLQKIFQNQHYSLHGVYYLRINHGGIWKYIVVDDFIPVRKVGKKYVPVFLSTTPSTTNYYEIWPYILQKALAKIYSSYQSLSQGNVHGHAHGHVHGQASGECSDFMHELTGIVGEKICMYEENPNKMQMRLRTFLFNTAENNDNIAMLSSPKINFFHDYPQFQRSNQIFTVLKPSLNQNTYFIHPHTVELLSESNNYQPPTKISIPFEYLQHYFDEINLYKVDESFCTMGCIIKQQRGSVQAKPGVFSGGLSIRKFRVSEYGECVLSVIQKDKKYFRNNGYEYAWIRLIVAVKDIEGYRYIDGKYGKQKVLSLNCQLNPGEFYVMMLTDWNRKPLQFTLNYEGTTEIPQIQRIPAQHSILQETCKDMAQRFGKFTQLTKNICSYQLKDYKNMLLIENFVNESERENYLHRRYRLPEEHGYYVFGNRMGMNRDRRGGEISETIPGEGQLVLVCVFVGEMKREQWDHAVAFNV